MELGLSELGQIAMTVKNLGGAVSYYRDVLGLPYLFEAPGLAFFRLGGVRLMLSGLAEERASGASVLYFKVFDIRGAYDELKRRGVTFEGEPHLIAKMPDHELWMAFFRDAEGNLLALMDEVRAN